MPAAPVAPAALAALGARRRWRLAPLSLALLAPCAQGAAFLPGAEASPPAPPTGEVNAAVPTALEPLAGDGIQWTLAPWRLRGLLAIDLRALRLEDGRGTRHGLLMGDVDMASHLWQPWFVQLRLGLGFVVAHSTGQASLGQRSGTVTGRAAVQVFPASRFPFELRADVSDSRTGGISLGGDYRSRRVSLSQGYRPEQGNDHLQLQLDHSQLDDRVSRDTLSTINATALHQAGPHTFDLALSASDNRLSDGSLHTRLAALSGRHGFRPSNELNVDTLASWNEVRLAGGGLGGRAGAADGAEVGSEADNEAGSEVGSEVRQLSTLATWRPLQGLWAGAGAPLVAATARWVEARALGRAGAPDERRADAVNLSLGVSQDLTPGWRAALSAAAHQLHSGRGPDIRSLGLQGSLGWAPASMSWAQWRYTPSASLSGGYGRDRPGSTRSTTGLQGTHGVSRDVPWGAASLVSLAFSQSAAALQESGASATTRALAHGASVAWQSQGADGSQTYGGLSYSDSLTRGERRGRFQLLNLQFSQRQQLSRLSHWAGHLTLQGTHNRSSELDAFSGMRREAGQGWQNFYSGAMSYEHQRAFGVQRLRHTVLASVSSQPLERRALGDIDAPRERISESLESRLDYAIGRLDTRLSLRVARVEGRVVAALQARAQRRF